MKRLRIGFYLSLTCNLLTMTSIAQTNNVQYQSPAYTIYSNRVVQGKFEAKVLSDHEMSSNYKSPVNDFKTSVVTFKFSINGKDNEMIPDMNHQFNLVTAQATTPAIPFGKQLKLKAGTSPKNMPANANLTLRVDIRQVLAAFKTTGFYLAKNGDKIFKEDFKGVYAAGGTAPLTWDFANLANNAGLEMKDPDGDGIYEVTIAINNNPENAQVAGHWKATKNTVAFPQYHSEYPLTNAIYNMTLEEMMNAVEPDSTFRTGKEWAGVWTRDISYSILLSMAYLQPAVAKYSLLKKVNGKKKIIQDTGTGGAWPVSSDRTVWTVAAYELYKATGDADWLKEAYTISKNSIEDDYLTLYNPVTGLVKGESSFLDWREQTYPTWMQPADIFESENLGTSAVHYQVNILLAKMANMLNQPTDAARFNAMAAKIKAGINQYLWMPEKGYYGQFRYGRFQQILSPKAEALGEALCVLFDIADGATQQKIVANTPQTAYGIPCIYPQIPGIPPYHNNGVWPFVQSFWLWAAAKAGHEQAVMESMAAIYRPAALFLTNKENFVADDGDFLGTQINSSNMLWSLSGNLSIVHKVLFGIQFNDDHLALHPFVPKAYAGKRSLTNFKYRNAILNIEMEGYGNEIARITLDGKTLSSAVIPANLTGNHEIKIQLSNNNLPLKPMQKLANKTAPLMPVLKQDGRNIRWAPIKTAIKYRVIKDGKIYKTTTQPFCEIATSTFAEYSVIATDKQGLESFASEPLQIVAPASVKIIELENHAGLATFENKGFTGKGSVEISTTVNTSIQIPVEIAADGVYLIDFRYANGNGPINTLNKCAIRTLQTSDGGGGALVFPHRGTNEWSNWGFSNALKLPLKKGKQILTLSYLPHNENMNGEINQALLDYMRIIKTGYSK